MPTADPPLDAGLLALHAETKRLASAMTDPAIGARLVEIAGEILELAARDGRIWQTVAELAAQSTAPP